jgi:hypothetical protein
MILDYVGDDKPTLARCMRSSLQLNLLAAPRLYGHLRWGSKLSCPIDIPSPTTAGSSITRLSPTKRENLELIRTFHLDYHRREDCAALLCAPARKENIIPVPVLHYATEDRRAILNGHYVKPEHLYIPIKSRCFFLPHIGPRKLVITDAHFNHFLPLRSVDERFLTKVVMFAYLGRSGGYGTLQRQYKRPFFRASTSGKTIVYIIIAMDSDYDLHSDLGIRPFCEHLAEVVYQPEFAQDVLVVNAIGRNRHPSVNHNPSSDLRYVRLETEARSTLKATSRGSSHDGRLEDPNAPTRPSQTPRPESSNSWISETTWKTMRPRESLPTRRGRG